MTKRRSALKPTFASPKVAAFAAPGASSRNRAVQRRLYMAAVLAMECGGFAAAARFRRLSLRAAQRERNLDTITAESTAMTGRIEAKLKQLGDELHHLPPQRSY